MTNNRNSKALSLFCAVSLGIIPGFASGHIDVAKAAGDIESMSVKKSQGPGSRGWQGDFVYSASTGSGGVFFHYPCPSSAPIAVNGGFTTNGPAMSGFVLVGNAPRANLAYNEWGWDIRWAGGAPAGSQITFNVYCLKKNPTQ